MTKLLYFGDPHIRGTTPRNRLDDYKETLKAKFTEIFELAALHQVDAIIQPGDTFDRPEVSTSVLLEFVDVMNQSPAPIYTTAGNHDIYGYNLATFPRTSLKLLELLVPRFHVINDPSFEVPITSGFSTSPADLVQVTFTPYSSQIDRDGYGYSPEGAAEETNAYKIHVSHGMLLDHEPPFDRYTHVMDVNTAADLVLCGHDHSGFGIFKRGDGKIFANPGSITRLSASKLEMERTVQVMLITVENKQCELDLIPLKTARPGEEVLDRSRIEAEQKRQYAMESFAALIQAETGDAVLLDINQIIETIAEQEEIAPDVIRTALEKIEEQRIAANL